MKSNKLPYVIAGSAIGGTAAFLLLTDSGRRFTAEIRKMDANTIPGKMEQVRGALERRAGDVSRKVDAVRDKITGSIDAGRRAFNESGEGMRSRLHSMEETNGKVASGVHRSVDELNRTLYSLEKSVLDPVYQVLSLIQAVKGGVRNLRPERNAPEGEQRNVTPMYDRERVQNF